MDELLILDEIPRSREMYMIAGWEQWADAGNISSGLPQYLIDHMDARRIGSIVSDPFYLFQFPGTHHLLRPIVTLEEGMVKDLEEPRNEFYFAGNEEKGLIIFVGNEPHLGLKRYTRMLLDTAEATGVKRIITLGGVYGSIPYDKDRDVSCAYSLATMSQELVDYAVRFSNYEGGSTVGTYMIHAAAQRDMEALAFYGFVPAYDFSHLDNNNQILRVDNDFRAWYEIMRRVNFMVRLGIDLSDLARRSDDLNTSIEEEIDKLASEIPQLRGFLAQLTVDYKERPFMPLDSIWADELGDILDDFGGE